MKNLIVNKKYNNKKLIDFLKINFPNLKNNTIYKALRQKDILVNSKRINTNIILKENDELIIYIDDKFFDMEFNLEIVYEDDNILIINKPYNISVTENDNFEKTLTYYVGKYCSNAKPCHRLDRNTCGLIIYAKNETTLNSFISKFKNGEIHKYYSCITYGIPKGKNKTITSYLFKDRKKSRVYISDVPKKGYQKINTSYNVLKVNENDNTSLLEVKLHTGRTHQIRAHLAHLGYPIIGDGKYGIDKINKKFKQTTQLLCAYKLKFNSKEFTLPIDCFFDKNKFYFN